MSLVPAAFGLPSVRAVTEALHLGRVSSSELFRLCPVVFEAASTGDEVGRAVVERQAEEIVLMVSTTLRRLDLLEVEVPVVFGGGVLASGDARLISGVSSGLG